MAHNSAVKKEEFNKYMGRCDDCAYYVYDEEYDEYVCEANMDEDDFSRMMEQGTSTCRYYRDGDEYRVVRHQM
jgi:hypothetical protein